MVRKICRWEMTHAATLHGDEWVTVVNTPVFRFGLQS
jgi:hypothetical protein